MDKKILVGLAGPAGCGKDTAAKYLAAAFALSHASFARPIKDALSAMGFDRRRYDNDEAKDLPIEGLGVSYRKLAQTLGTEWARSLNPEFWLLIAKRQWRKMQSDLSFRGMVISDARFPNEADWLRKEGVLIHINGPSRRTIAGDGKAHASEVPLEKAPGDLVVSNTGSMTFLFGQLNAVVARLID